MEVSTEIVIAVTSCILALLGGIGAMVWVVRGLVGDARDAARQFAGVIEHTRQEFDAHQAARLVWEQDGRTLRDQLDDHADRIRELEQTCEDSERTITQQAAALTELKVQVADLKRQVAERDARITRLNERIEKLETENSRLVREEAHWRAERGAWSAERASLLQERLTLEARVAEMQVEIETIKKKGTGPLAAMPTESPEEDTP